MPPLTDDELALRAGYLGGTDMAALAGVSTWSRPIDVFYEKRPDLAPPGWGRKPTNAAMSMGHVLEPVVADLFTLATGVRLRRLPRSLRCKDHPWEGGNLDRRAACGGVFEAKWTTARTGWGPMAPPELELHEPYPVPAGELPPVPAAYYVQVQWYMHIARRAHAHLAVLLGYGEFRHYTLARNDDMVEVLVRLGEDFWHGNVVPGVPPPPDGSDSWSAAVRARYPTDSGEELPATPEQWLALQTLRGIRHDAAELSKADAEICQRLQDQMRTAAALVGDGVRVSWAQTKPVLKVRWEEMLTDMLRGDYAANGKPWPTTKKAAAELVRQFATDQGWATTEPGARPFKVTFSDEE